MTNTAPQVLVYEAMGATPPVFAHVPVVNAPNSNKKLSKRDAHKFVTPDVIALLRAVHAVPGDWTDEQIKKNETLNPVMVEYYRVMGYLPAGLINYLGRLGWSLDDKTEIMPLETMIANFGFERVNQAPASFDPQKLHWVAGEYMKTASLERKIDGVIPILQRAGLLPPSPLGGEGPGVRGMLHLAARPPHPRPLSPGGARGESIAPRSPRSSRRAGIA